MAARRTKGSGLSDEDVSALRDQLSGGRRPRVQLSGPQFAEDAAGTVVRIGDPAVAGTDYITVRVKVNGIADELAFAPGELSLRRAGTAAKARTSRAAGRARPAAKAAPAAKVAPAAATPAAPALAASHPATPSTAPQPAKQPAPQPAKPPIRAAATQADRPQRRTAGTAKVADPSGSSGRRRKPAAPPKVSFSVTSSGASWSVTASRGAKGIAKNQAVPPGVVSAIAALLDQPALVEAVAEINETALAEAQARAEQLRAELDQLEAVLATHRNPR